MTYQIPFPATFRIDEDDAGVVHEYLQNNGHVVEGVSINVKDQLIFVDANSDPTSTITNYSPPLTARQKAKAALIELNGINLDTATTAELRQALKLMRGLINYEIRTP